MDASHPFGSRAWRWATLAALIAIGGCAQEPASTEEDSTGAQAVIAEARAGGASEEQIAILEKGEIPSFEDYEAAVARSLACIRDAGIHTQAPQEVEQGVTKLAYGYGISSPGRTDAQTDEIAQACISEHSLWVEMAWMDQPLSREWADEQRESERPTLVACLEAFGVTVDESLTTAEVDQLFHELLVAEGGALTCPDGLRAEIQGG